MGEFKSLWSMTYWNFQKQDFDYWLQLIMQHCWPRRKIVKRLTLSLIWRESDRRRICFCRRNATKKDRSSSRKRWSADSSQACLETPRFFTGVLSKVSRVSRGEEKRWCYIANRRPAGGEVHENLQQLANNFARRHLLVCCNFEVQSFREAHLCCNLKCRVSVSAGLVAARTERCVLDAQTRK